MVYHTQYHPLIAASAVGLVWCVLRYPNTERCSAIDYTILGICALLGVGSYSGMKDVAAMPDAAGIVWIVAGLSALAMTIMLTVRSRIPHTDGMLQT